MWSQGALIGAAIGATTGGLTAGIGSGWGVPAMEAVGYGMMATGAGVAYATGGLDGLLYYAGGLGGAMVGNALARAYHTAGDLAPAELAANQRDNGRPVATDATSDMVKKRTFWGEFKQNMAEMYQGIRQGVRTFSSKVFWFLGAADTSIQAYGVAKDIQNYWKMAELCYSSQEPDVVAFACPKVRRSEMEAVGNALKVGAGLPKTSTKP